LKVYVNGVVQRSGDGNDYVEQGNNQIVFEYAPWVGAQIEIDYTSL